MEHTGPRILIVASAYLPGFKAGGPIRSLANLVAHLGGEFDFRILTSDRDLGDAVPYADIQPDVWTEWGNNHVMYLSPDKQRLRSWRGLLTALDYDVIYLNAFFSTFTIYTLLLRRLRQVPARPVILAPRGEFSPGALQLKWLKKRAFLLTAGFFGLYRNLLWQASSNFEAQEIRDLTAQFRLDSEPAIIIAPNPPPKLLGNAHNPALRNKKSGIAQFVFLSRIARKKNLHYALNLLCKVPWQVRFDIYGPIEDTGYWQECEQIIGTLPASVQVSYHGPVPADQVPATFASYHAFLFPTHGENFGHVILEALSAGCPVITSDQTPWRDLAARQAGWDLPLEQPDAFLQVIQQVIDMDQPTWETWSLGARGVADAFIHDPSIVEANRQLFYAALAHE